MNHLLKSDKIVGYTYKAETLCPKDVIETLIFDFTLADEVMIFDQSSAIGVGFEDPRKMATEAVLDLLAKDFSIDRTDDYTFDSDDFPKIILAVQVDGDERCDHCGDSLI